jgi:hypothetical protein
VLADLEKVLGTENPSTVLLRYHFALCLQKEGKFAEAEKQTQQALVAAMKDWGPKSPNTQSLEKLLNELKAKK